jgi:hypothetical protein
MFQRLVSVHIDNLSYLLAGQGFLFVNKFKAVRRRESILLRLRMSYRQIVHDRLTRLCLQRGTNQIRLLFFSRSSTELTNYVTTLRSDRKIINMGLKSRQR